MTKTGKIKVDQSEVDLLNILSSHPELKKEVQELVNIVENADGHAVKADDAEEQIAQQLRKIGQTALQTWANRKLEEVDRHYQASAGHKRREKKSSIGTVDSEKSE